MPHLYMVWNMDFLWSILFILLLVAGGIYAVRRITRWIDRKFH